MYPSTSARKRRPGSTACESVDVALAGDADGSQMLHGHVNVPASMTLTVWPAVGVSLFPLSSTARERITADPSASGVHENVQFVVPVAACQVAPLSVDTST